MTQPAWSRAGGGQTNTSWPAPSLPSLSWGTEDPGQSGDWAGCGDSLWIGEQKGKSFLVTYFLKLPLAPVSLAWTVPSRPLSTQDQSSSLA